MSCLVASPRTAQTGLESAGWPPTSSPGYKGARFVIEFGLEGELRY